MLEKYTFLLGRRLMIKSENRKYRRILKKILKDQIAEGAKIFCNAAAIGFETLAAQTVIRMRKRKKYRHIKFYLLDFGHEQGFRWIVKTMESYEKIRQEADFILRVPDEESACDTQLYERVLRNADINTCCVCSAPFVLGNSYYLVDLARHLGLKVIIIRNLQRNYVDTYERRPPNMQKFIEKSWGEEGYKESKTPTISLP